MKQLPRLAAWLALIIFFSLTLAAGAAAEGESLHVLFTHDLHSHLDPLSSGDDDAYTERGGLARLQTMIKQAREREGELLLVDAGDFSMGTLYHTIFTTEAAELLLLGQMGYDAVALGEHEFDAGAAGLTAMLDAARDSGDPLPELVGANIDWPASLKDEAKDGAAPALHQALADYGAAPYTIVEKKGLRIAVFGVMGREAGAGVREDVIAWTDPIASARQVVDQLQGRAEPPDMIVCLSHSGLNADPEKSADELLAAAVPEIDLIISAHSHTALAEPIIVGDTTIAAAGCYGAWLGGLELARTAGGRWQVQHYELRAVDAATEHDLGLQVKISAFKKRVQRQYLNPLGYKFDQVLATSPFAFSSPEDFAGETGEDSLGNLIADSYLFAVNRLAGDGPGSAPTTIALVPAETVRGSFDQGAITVSEAFSLCSTGYGADGSPGYPLVCLYLTGADLKTLAELDASMADLWPHVRLHSSGLSYTFNPHRLRLNRVTDIKLRHANGAYYALEDEPLYPVVMSLDTAQNLRATADLSYNLLSITPRDEKGEPLADFSRHIVRREDGAELKAWCAVASYLESFAPQDGVAVIPEYYHTTHDRKIIDASTNMLELVKQPNKYAYTLLGAALLALLLLLLLIRAVIRKIRGPRNARYRL